MDKPFTGNFTFNFFPNVTNIIETDTKMQNKQIIPLLTHTSDKATQYIFHYLLKARHIMVSRSEEHGCDQLEHERAQDNQPENEPGHQQ